MFLIKKMVELILRWTYGEIKNGYNSPQGLELLKYSIKFAVLIFPEEYDKIEYYICYNNIKKSTLREIKKLSKKYGVKLINVSDMLPRRLRNDTVKNSWWKYALPRVDLDKYELIIDNDIIFWELPMTLKIAIANNGLVALSDAAGKFYGEYSKKVNSLERNLKLNAGIIGFPKGFAFNLTDVLEEPPKDCFFSEQGFTAFNFSLYKGLKYLIPLSEVQQLNINRIGAIELLSYHKGGHFCGCNYGPEDFWDKIYRNPIIKKYTEIKYNLLIQN